MNVDRIERFYNIGRIQRCAAIEQGKSSDAKCVTSSAGRFVLRKLRNQQQAVNEDRLHRVLSLHHISPALVNTRNGGSHVRDHDGIYNLQHYIEGTRPFNQASIQFVYFGQMLAQFHSLIGRLEIADQPDRFALPLLWAQVCDKVRGSSSAVIGSLEEHVQRCMRYAVRDEGVVHGDLGVWNMLFTEQRTVLIDFGEARRGDPHFDVAAALTSMIPEAAAEHEFFSALEDVMRGYAEAGGLLKKERLYEQIHLWMLRGWLALIRERGVTSPVVRYIEQGMRRIITLNRMIL